MTRLDRPVPMHVDNYGKMPRDIHSGRYWPMLSSQESQIPVDGQGKHRRAELNESQTMTMSIKQWQEEHTFQMTDLRSRWITANCAVTALIRRCKIMIILERDGLDCDAEQDSTGENKPATAMASGRVHFSHRLAPLANYRLRFDHRKVAEERVCASSCKDVCWNRSIHQQYRKNIIGKKMFFHLVLLSNEQSFIGRFFLKRKKTNIHQPDQRFSVRSECISIVKWFFWSIV